MIRFERSFIQGLVLRGLALGAVAAALSWLLIDGAFALGLLSGLVLMCANILSMTWLLESMRDAPGVRTPGPKTLAALFLLKLLVLFGLTYYLLAEVGLSPAGLALGFVLGLGALSWQVITGDRAGDSQETSRPAVGDEEE